MKRIHFIIFICLISLLANAQVKKDSSKAKVTYRKTGIVSKTRYEMIKTDNLLQSINDNIAKDYPGYTIKEAYRARTKNVTEYEVRIKKDKSIIILLYDKEGIFIKKK
jgi:hypothetical protein